MLKIRIPASTANIGSGFDSLGIALNLYNYIEIEVRGLFCRFQEDQLFAEWLLGDADMPAKRRNTI